MSTLRRRTGCLAMLLVVAGCGQATDTSRAATATAPAATLGEPNASGAPVAHPLRDQSGPVTLDPGTYVLDLFPVDLAFDIPDGDPPGWHAGAASADEAIVLWLTPPEITYVFAFWNVDNVYIDPCDATAGEQEPPLGPSVSDLVAALSSLPGLQATAPADVTVGAFRGKEISLTALDSGGACPDVIAFSAGESNVGFAAGDTLRVQILDVNGVRIVMSMDRWVNTRESLERHAAAEAELQQILDSIRIEPMS
jgi:hypothetical protein